MHRILTFFLLSLAGCDLIEDLIGGGPPDLSGAQSQLASGDLPGAAAAYQAAAQDAPTDVDAASGAAYAALLTGDYAAADAALAAAEVEAGERAGEIKLRRALVALEAGELEKVKTFGEASGTDVGYLLAAEVDLANGEREDAIALLNRIANPGPPKRTARKYLSLLGSDEPTVSGLSEAAALWALGERKVAVRSVEELIKNLPDDRNDRDALLLLWASRAAALRENEVARRMLDAILFPPENQAWRKAATSAIISCSEGKGQECLELFEKLEGNAPADGLADAKATAAYLIAEQDAEVAQALAGSLRSNAAARALLETGDRAAAREAASPGALKKYLSGG